MGIRTNLLRALGFAKPVATPARTGRRQYQGAIISRLTADWLAKTTFEDLANSNAGTSLVWEFVGTTAIAST
jgi:hypothetical protein